MKMHPFHRSELLIGGEGWQHMGDASVCVIGLGGVGSYAAEAMARTGVGHLTLVDFDRVCVTNINRQLHATRKTVGASKAELMAQRARDIHPNGDIRCLPVFYNAESRQTVLDRRYDYVFDCIDNMTAKIDLLETCVSQNLPVISAMGAGGRMDPTRVRVSDISQTSVDPFARIVRQLLRTRGITKGVECVWSDEPPNILDRAAQEGFRCICPDRADSPHSCDGRFQIQGSVAWMPSLFGLMMAGTATNRLLGRDVRGLTRNGREQKLRPSRHKIAEERKRQLLAEAGFIPIPSPSVKPRTPAASRPTLEESMEQNP